MPGLRLGDPRAHALLAALCVFRLLPRGFANRDLRPILAQLLGVPAESIPPGKMTCALRPAPPEPARTRGLAAATRACTSAINDLARQAGLAT